jgi:hypothetical protein
VETPPGWIGVETKRAVNGAAVTAIVLDGPATKAGLIAGDVEVVKEEDFEVEIASLKPGISCSVQLGSKCLGA